MDPVWTALIGAAVGGALSGGSVLLAGHLGRKNEERVRFHGDRLRVYAQFSHAAARLRGLKRGDMVPMAEIEAASIEFGRAYHEVMLIARARVARACRRMVEFMDKGGSEDLAAYKEFLEAARDELGAEKIPLENEEP